MESIPIILESGRFYCCGGWSVNNLPSVHFTALKREFESMNTILNPGGWASFLSSHSKHSLLYEDDQESLWYHTSENLFGNETAPVALLDARLLTKEDYNKTAEFFFETMNVPQLTISSEATASINALFCMDFSYVTPSTAKNSQGHQVTQETSPFSPSFSGVIVTADFETLRMQPFFNGLPASNFKTHHPFGERVPKALLYSKVHGTVDSHKDITKSTNKIQKTLSDLELIRSNDQVYEEWMSLKHHPKTIQNICYDHLCCWRTVQFLYDQYCYVSFDPDMDSWLVQRHLEKKEENETDIRLEQCCCLRKIVEHIPTWTMCSDSLDKNINDEYAAVKSAASTNIRKLEKKYVCGLCSQLKRNCNETSPEHKNYTNAGNKGFVNVLGHAFVSTEREIWKTTLNRTSLTLEQLIQKTLRNSIFLAPEILFRPSALISSLYTSSTLVQTIPSSTYASSLMSVSDWEANSSTWVPQNIADEILSIIDKSPIDLRREMYRSTVILGKMTTLPFLTNRLVLEIQTGIYNRLKKSKMNSRSAAESVAKESIHVWNPSQWSNKIYASWIGAKHALEKSSNNSSFVQTLSREKNNNGDALIFKKGTFRPIDVKPIPFSPTLDPDNKLSETIDPTVIKTTTTTDFLRDQRDVETSKEKSLSTNGLQNTMESISTDNKQTNPLNNQAIEEKREAELIFPSLTENVGTHSDHVVKPIKEHRNTISDFIIDQDHAFMQRVMTSELLTHLNIKKAQKVNNVIGIKQTKEGVSTEILNHTNSKSATVTSVSLPPFKNPSYFSTFFKNSDATILWITGAFFLMLLSILTITLCLPKAISKY